MAVALDEATVAKLGPSAQAQIRERHAPEPSTQTEPRGKVTPIKPRYSAPNQVRTAARATRAGFRFAGSGRANTGGNPTIRGVLWLFVWIGVLFYLVANPSTLPRLIHLVFAPVNGVLAVAKGPHVAAAKTA